MSDARGAQNFDGEAVKKLRQRVVTLRPVWVGLPPENAPKRVRVFRATFLAGRTSGRR
jgi:hypothetical protein